jgi:hypothetical protein
MLTARKAKQEIERIAEMMRDELHTERSAAYLQGYYTSVAARLEKVAAGLEADDAD